MQTNDQNQDAALTSAEDNNPVPEPARSSEEIVPLQRMVRELAETFERRAAEWRDAQSERHAMTAECAAEIIYTELARDFRAVIENLRGDGNQTL